MIVIKVALLSLLLCFAPSVFAEPLSYIVDVKNSSLAWKTKKIIGVEHYGTINIIAGSIIKDGDLFSGKIIVDMNSIVVLDLKDKKEATTLLEHIRSNDFFKVVKFPTARLDIVSVKQKQDTDYTIVANFTIVDHKQQITFPAKINFVDNQANAEGSVDIDEVFTLTFNIKSIR